MITGLKALKPHLRDDRQDGSLNVSTFVCVAASKAMVVSDRGAYLLILNYISWLLQGETTVIAWLQKYHKKFCYNLYGSVWPQQYRHAWVDHMIKTIKDSL